MSSNNIISVIDIGTTKIVALIGRREENGTFSILGLGHVVSKGVKRGNVFNITDTIKNITEAVSVAERQAEMKMNEVYVGIAGQNIECIVNADYINRIHSEEEITEKEITDFVKNQENITLGPGRQLLQVIPKQFELDGDSVENPIGCIGKRLEAKFHLIIGASININSIKKSIVQSGLKLKKIFLEPIASSKAVLYPEEIEAGVAMIDIGGGTTDLAIYHKNMLLHTAVIPFGGSVVTLDIQQAFGLTYNEAERLKLTFGKAVPDDKDSDETVVIKSNIQGRENKEIGLYNISNIIQARVEEIFGFINHQFELANANKFANLGLVITGGGALLKNIPQLSSYCTTLETRIGYPLVHINQNSQKIMNNPQYSTAIGLLIMGYEDSMNIKPIEKQDPFAEFNQKNNKPVEETKDDFINKKKKVVEDDFEEDPPKPKKIKKERKSIGILDKVKSTLTGIFDDSDTKL